MILLLGVYVDIDVAKQSPIHVVTIGLQEWIKRLFLDLALHTEEHLRGNFPCLFFLCEADFFLHSGKVNSLAEYIYSVELGFLMWPVFVIVPRCLPLAFDPPVD